MKRIKLALILTSLLATYGCAKDYSLAPPAHGDSISVTLKVPVELVPDAMQVMYRSSTCRRLTRGGSGQRVELDGYHATKVELKRQDQSNLYRTVLIKDGGGACKWQLANITFGVSYAEHVKFGEGITHGSGAGVVVKFDGNKSPRDGYTREVKGDLTMIKDYYPSVYENHLGGYRKTVRLRGEGETYMIYKALSAREIYFEPVLHSDYIVYTVGPKVKKPGNHAKITYPDGSVQSDGRWGPDFRKLQAIRLKAEGKE